MVERRSSTVLTDSPSPPGTPASPGGGDASGAGRTRQPTPRGGGGRSDAQTTPAAGVGEMVEPQLERIDALFVQSATGFSSDADTVTLHGRADSTVFFAARPRREI